MRKSYASFGLTLAWILAAALPVATATAQELSLSYNSEWPPYSSGTGANVQGVLPALLDELLGARLGLELRHNGAPWKRAQRLVQQGSLDAFVTLPTESRLAFAKSSNSTVYSLEMLAIVKRGSRAETELTKRPAVESVSKLRVCDILGNGWAEQFYARNKVKFRTAKNVETCLRMIARGRMDVMIQPAAVAASQIKKAGLSDQIVVLPKAYDAMRFTLLLSKSFANADQLLSRFDALIFSMRQDGSYDELISRLRNR